LPQQLLEQLRNYYLEAGRPQEFLFTSTQTQRALHVRSMQLEVNSAMRKAGFESGKYTAHTLRHSFATHMLNQGNNIHVIKTLLGHSKLENYDDLSSFAASYATGNCFSLRSFGRWSKRKLNRYCSAKYLHMQVLKYTMLTANTY